MSIKKRGPATLADRVRAATGGEEKLQTSRVQITQSLAATKTMRNERRSERKEAFKQGVLIFATGERMKVVVKNISAIGARADFSGGLTSIFGCAHLSVPALGLERKVRIVWKDQSSAGLEFESDLSDGT